MQIDQAKLHQLCSVAFQQIEKIKKKTQIYSFQVKSWFANKRNRTNNTKPKVQVRAMEEKLLEVCQDLQMRNSPAADNSKILLKLSEVMSNLTSQKE